MDKASSFEKEKVILKYWEDRKVFAKLREQNKGNKAWSFLDGPITANNPMGVHHAWGRTLKDLYQRFKAMQGFDERYQNGFDCQGLWLEVETEKQLGFNSKKDIEHFGLDNFSKACRERVEKFSKVQTQQSIQLGQWMDWGNDYFTMNDDNIQSIWFFLKKCHEKGWLYKGKRILPWCIRCGTSSSKHEMSDEGYAELTHPSVYVKAKIKGKKNEYLLLWTTTEWTLSSNCAAAVNPNLTYVKVEKDGSLYYISEGAVSKLGANCTVLEKLSGKELVGVEYESFYPDFDVQKGLKHAVIAWDDVGATDGTGIVHIAPSCGDVDYDLGKKHKLAILESALDDFGNYIKGFGWLTSKNVKDVKKDIVADLDKRGVLFKLENYRHRYPVCWRCKEELVFRLDSSWFLACDTIRPLMKKEAAKVVWYPEHVGKLMQDWLDNMEDWNISRRRYWGLPLMFYECTACKRLEVIGSREELEKKAVRKAEVDKLPELHRPWIDAIKIKCSCGAEVERVKDVGDCWLDAGIVPFSTTKYFEDKKHWKKWFPAELEIEMRAQVRLWFYAQLFMSIVLEGVAPYKRILAYEEVRDEKGESMHKSKGNAIWFDEAVEKMSADVMRWQYCSQDPHYNLNFGYNKAEEIQRHLLIIHNLGQYVKQNCANPAATYSKDIASKWILSKKEHLKVVVTDHLEGLRYNKALEEIKNFLLIDLSKTYIQFMRDRFDDPAVQKVLYDSFLDSITLLAPFLPFTAEELNLELYKKESIHLQSWPTPVKKLQNPELEQHMSNASKIIEAVLFAREKAKTNVRWPIKEAIVVTESQEVAKAIGALAEIISVQTNVKELTIKKALAEVKENVRPNTGTLGKDFGSKAPGIIAALQKEKPSRILELMHQDSFEIMVGKEPVVLNKNHVRVERELPKQLVIAEFKEGFVYLDTSTTPELQAEGFAREIMRRVQQARKDVGLQKTQRIRLTISLPDRTTLSSDWTARIGEKCGANETKLTESPQGKHEFEADIRGQKVRMAFDVEE